MTEPFDVTQIEEEAGQPQAHDPVGSWAGASRSPVGDDPLRDLRRLTSIGKDPSDAVREAPDSGAIAEDPINPAHYRRHPSGIECIEVTRHMNFNVGNAIKYLWRYMDKGDPIENLKKAQWYIADEIVRLGGLHRD